MKKIFILIFLVFILSSCLETETKFIYTVTEFETIGDEENLNDHFETKQARNSNVYEVIFKDRENYERKLITSSDEKIVYHDFCKVGDIVYAVGGQFGKEYGTARLRQVYPNIENNEIYDTDEIRIRDCENIEQDSKKYLGMVTHGEGKFILYDIGNNSFLEDKNSSYKGEVDGRSYTGITMIHEVVSADLDGNGNKEFYYTPTSKNGPTYIDQKGKIFKAEIVNGKSSINEFYDLGDSYSKEIHKITLKNGKDIILSSIQGKTKINEKKEEKVKPRVSFKFKDGTEKVIKDVNEITDMIRPTIIKAFYFDNGKIVDKDLTQIKTTPQCRVIEYGDIYGEENKINFIVGCSDGIINIYSLDNDLNIELKDNLLVKGKQIHSVYFVDTDNDQLDEVFIGIDFDGMYHLDIKEEDKLFKMYDYSKKESWLWAIEGI